MHGILAVDPGSECGWAAYDPTDGVIRSGHFSVPPSPHLPGKRLQAFKATLTAIAGAQHLLTCRNDRGTLATELPHNLRGGGLFLLHYIATIQLLSEELDLNYIDRAPSQIKKWATGNGRATKRQILKFSRNLFHIPADRIITTDEADALCLLGLVMNEKEKRRIPEYDPTISSSSSS